MAVLILKNVLNFQGVSFPVSFTNSGQNIVLVWLIAKFILLSSNISKVLGGSCTRQFLWDDDSNIFWNGSMYVIFSEFGYLITEKEIIH